MLKNVGGDGRIGSGKKIQVYMNEYGRSTHNKSKAWRSTMCAGTLIPSFVEIGLNGDTWDIEIESIVRTLPTVGPLFGSYKMQVDFFTADIRLYNAQLHNNALNVGMNIEKIMFPMINLEAEEIVNETTDGDPNLKQINPSSILAYLGIRGLGCGVTGSSVKRTMNAMPLLAYWDIYKNYYANKQEEVGVAVTATSEDYTPVLSKKEGAKDITDWDNYQTNRDGESIAMAWNTMNEKLYNEFGGYGGTYPTLEYGYNNTLLAESLSKWEAIFMTVSDVLTNDRDTIKKYMYFTLVSRKDETIIENVALGDLFNYVDITNIVAQSNGKYQLQIQMDEMKSTWDPTDWYLAWQEKEQDDYTYRTCYGYWGELQTYIFETPALKTFKLENIDTMRKLILQKDEASPLIIGEDDGTNIEPYNIIQEYIRLEDGSVGAMVQTFANAGVGIKTYQSDRFNNWINTDWIDGANGINEITSIDTSDGKFTMDTLILQKKVYNMLNRIAMSGGSYNDWQEAVYGQQRAGKPETPVYVGGYSTEITFDEVISAAATEEEPLGTLGGRGSQKNGKQGYIRIKCDEPCVIMGIVSLTPRIDYSQGNSWIYKLETMNDLHKPALDGIGFQDLPTDEMAAWDTYTDEDGITTYKSAGKQPAYIEWQTSVNECYGNFADIDNQMYMTLNRRYEAERGDETLTIRDVTTYIDPTKYNYAFAQTSLDAQNFWVHLGFDTKVRRIMSAKEMPNL